MSLPYHVFISYSRADKARVTPWADKLREGGLNPFVDSQCLVGGVDWQKEIVDAIDSAKVVFFIASRTSFSSEYTKKELAIAEKRKKTIVPIYLEPANAPGAFEFMLVLNQAIAGYDRSVEEIWDDILKALAREKIEWKPPVAPTPPPTPIPPPVVVLQPPVVAVPERRFVREPLDLGSDIPVIVGPDEPVVLDTPAIRKPTRSLNERRSTKPLTAAPTPIEPVPAPIDLNANETPTAITEAMNLAEGHRSTKNPISPSKRELHPISKSALAPTIKGGTRSRRKLAWMLSAGVLSCLGYLFMGPKPQAPSANGNTTVLHPPVIQQPVGPVTSPPVLVTKTGERFTDAAIRVTQAYYEPAIRGKSECKDMDSKVSYFGEIESSASLAKQFERETREFPLNSFKLDRKPEIETMDEASRTAICRANVSFVTGHAAMKQSGTLIGLVTVQLKNGEPKIIAIGQQAGARKATPIQYNASEQSRLAIEFVTAAILDRNKRPTPDASEFAERYADKVSYKEKTTPRAQVAQSIVDDINADPLAQYVIEATPQMISGASSSKVRVAASFKCIHKRGFDQAEPEEENFDALFDLNFTLISTPFVSISLYTEMSQPSPAK